MYRTCSPLSHISYCARLGSLLVDLVIIILQVKYYSASEFEINRYEKAILKYQVGMKTVFSVKIKHTRKRILLKFHYLILPFHTCHKTADAEKI